MVVTFYAKSKFPTTLSPRHYRICRKCDAEKSKRRRARRKAEKEAGHE